MPHRNLEFAPAPPAPHTVRGRDKQPLLFSQVRLAFDPGPAPPKPQLVVLQGLPTPLLITLYGYQPHSAQLSHLLVPRSLRTCSTCCLTGTPRGVSTPDQGRAGPYTTAPLLFSGYPRHHWMRSSAGYAVSSARGRCDSQLADQVRGKQEDEEGPHGGSITVGENRGLPLGETG
jgi:hypothetical protein